MKPGRNDPCPCGSGEKYKKCCGKTISIVSATRVARSSAERECGHCNACCNGTLSGNIYGHEMGNGTPCHFIKQGGCSIYEQRPLDPCHGFFCGWVLPNSPFPEWFKPDQSNVMVVITKWRNRPAYHLLSGGRYPGPAVMKWMMEFSHRTGHPFFYEENSETLGYGPREFQEDMAQRIARGEPLW